MGLVKSRSRLGVIQLTRMLDSGTEKLIGKDRLRKVVYASVEFEQKTYIVADCLYQRKGTLWLALGLQFPGFILMEWWRQSRA